MQLKAHLFPIEVSLSHRIRKRTHGETPTRNQSGYGNSINHSDFINCTAKSHRTHCLLRLRKPNT